MFIGKNTKKGTQTLKVGLGMKVGLCPGDIQGIGSYGC